MALESDIIHKAIETLENEGVLFEDSSEVGMYLATKASRNELKDCIDKHFQLLQHDTNFETLNIVSKPGYYYYFILVWDFIDELYPQFKDYHDAIRKVASIHYDVPESDITFEFL